MSLLVICKILGLLVNTLTADGQYSLDNRQIIPQQIQIQLSKKEIPFVDFCSISDIYINFWTFWQKIWTWSLIYFPNYGVQKSWLDKYPKKHILEHSSIVNMLKGLKHCLDIHDSTSTISFHSSGGCWPVKCLC